MFTNNEKGDEKFEKFEIDREEAIKRLGDRGGECSDGAQGGMRSTAPW